MSKIVELRPDRNLIRNNFDGYKLSLDPVPLLRQELSHLPFRAEPNEDQYVHIFLNRFSTCFIYIDILKVFSIARGTLLHAKFVACRPLGSYNFLLH